MTNYISFIDLLLVPIYLIVIYLISSRIVSNNKKIIDYKFFQKGLFLKFLGVLLFCVLYLFYYGGGDTINYFKGVQSLVFLLIETPEYGVQGIFNYGIGSKYWDVYNESTGKPPYYMWKDPNTFSVCRFTAFLYILGSGRFLITSLLTAAFSYIGIWKIYRLFNMLYPGNQKALAYLILFLPSLLFWGGGIMKDSFVLGATCWITYNFFKVFIERKKVFLNVLFLSMNLLIIINLKAYVVASLIPGMVIWTNNAYLKRIKNRMIKTIIFPLFIVGFGFIGFYSFNNVSEQMGVYGNVDSAILQAQVIQDDLLRNDQYGNNNYDIGKLDGSVSNLLSLAPLAVFTALFRPLLWEIGSPTMIISAVENTILLIVLLFFLTTVGPFQLFKRIISEPFLMYCLIFSLIFAFGVGIAGTNFGALVRYKIPLMPFFLSSLYIIRKKNP
jgi:hypothetical protein